MEALELHREELRKTEEHKYACEGAGKQVPYSNITCRMCHIGTYQQLYCFQFDSRNWVLFFVSSSQRWGDLGLKL